MSSHQPTQSMALAPYLNTRDAAGAIDFYTRVFGAVETVRLVDPDDGKIGHAELQFGNSVLMLSDEYPAFGACGPEKFGGSPVKMHLLVDDVDTVFDRAVDNGATVIRKLENQFHGHRGGVIADPFSHVWHLQTKIEDVSAQDMQQRWNDSVEL